MHQLKDKKYKLFFYLILFMLLSTINISHNNNKNHSVVAIKKIKVSGLSNLDNLKEELVNVSLNGALTIPASLSLTWR